MHNWIRVNCLVLVLLVSGCVTELEPNLNGDLMEPPEAAEWRAECLQKYDQEIARIGDIIPDVSEPQRPNTVDPGSGDEALYRNAPLNVSDRDEGPALLEGMSGGFSPYAIWSRKSARMKNEARPKRLEAAEAEKGECLALTPVFPENGICPEGFALENTPDNLYVCYPEPEPFYPPAAMSTDKAFRVMHLRPIIVAFNGGSHKMRHAIRQIAQDWADQTNTPTGYTRDGEPWYADIYGEALRFDFGEKTDDGFVFNTWSHEDTEYAADIRISFEKGAGNWSLIGTSSTLSSLAGPGIASMNLDGMDGYSKLRFDWKQVVYHEFGHALGLQHEHQHPMSECGAALRLEDDEDYVLTLDDYGQAIVDPAGKRPGVLTLVEHAPNYWSRADAEFNLGQLKRSRNIDTTPFDPNSIMRYDFAAEWYRDDAPEECLPTGIRATEPSKHDFAMVANTYKAIMRAQVRRNAAK